jgi:hypothetical protein
MADIQQTLHLFSFGEPSPADGSTQVRINQTVPAGKKWFLSFGQAYCEKFAGAAPNPAQLQVYFTTDLSGSHQRFFISAHETGNGIHTVNEFVGVWLPAGKQLQGKTVLATGSTAADFRYNMSMIVHEFNA